MAEDWYIAAIDRVEGAANDLHEALDLTVEALREARSERLAGVGVGEIVRRLVTRGGREVRLAPTRAFREFERAVTAYRAAAIRALVDEEHMTFSRIGELTGVSRKMIARLYRSAGDCDAAAIKGRDDH